MMTKIEEVARALREVQARPHTDADVARAAIEAMREPDQAMRLASERYKRTAKVYSGPECFRKMIDAALGEA